MVGKVVDVTSEGMGVVRADKVVFVQEALPDDVVRYEIIQEKKKFRIGRVTEWVEYSSQREHRTNALGDAFPLYPLKESTQMKIKYSHLEHNLSKIAGVQVMRTENEEELSAYKVPAEVAEQEGLNHGRSAGEGEKPAILLHSSPSYRLNKLRLHVNDGRLGFYRSKSHDLYTPNYDMLLGKEGAEVVHRLEDALTQGHLRKATYVIIRRSTENGFYLATDGVVSRVLLEYFQGVLDKDGMHGEKPAMEVQGVRYRVDIDGFFQNSESMSAKALEIIGQKKRGRVLDLYSGVGFLSLFVGKKAESVLGVEANAAAVENAKYNAVLNGVEAEFIAMDTARYMEKNTRYFDTIIVDPPRSGLVPSVIEGIGRVRPEELIYMSCNHATLCRDLNSLLEWYRMEAIHLLDMFKGAVDSEVIVIMKRKGELVE